LDVRQETRCKTKLLQRVPEPRMSGFQAPERNEDCARPSKDDLGAVVVDREENLLGFNPARSC
jgi:hypothetical protein